jgi:hypothetical protein
MSGIFQDWEASVTKFLDFQIFLDVRLSFENLLVPKNREWENNGAFD